MESGGQLWLYFIGLGPLCRCFVGRPFDVLVYEGCLEGFLVNDALKTVDG